MYVQCCHLGNFLARFRDFSDPLNDFISKKRLVKHLATYPDHQGKGEKIFSCSSRAAQSDRSPRLSRPLSRGCAGGRPVCVGRLAGAAGGDAAAAGGFEAG